MSHERFAAQPGPGQHRCSNPIYDQNCRPKLSPRIVVSPTGPEGPGGHCRKQSQDNFILENNRRGIALVVNIVIKIVGKIVAPVALNLVKYIQLGDGTLGGQGGQDNLQK